MDEQFGGADHDPHDLGDFEPGLVFTIMRVCGQESVEVRRIWERHMLPAIVGKSYSSHIPYAYVVQRGLNPSFQRTAFVSR